MNTQQQQHEKIRVYVGTYHKHNNSSLAGRWLTLNDYKTPQEFWAACRAIHRDEKDPEFMFQDYEVPDFLGGCVTECHIDTKEIWAYLNAPVAPEEEPEAKEYSKAQLKAWKEEFVEWKLADVGGYHVSEQAKKEHDDYWRPYYMKKYLAVIKLSDGRFFPVEKQSIKTTFCFGAGCNGVSTAEDWKDAANAQAAIHQYDNWLKANTEDIESEILVLTDNDPYNEDRHLRVRGLRPFCSCYEKELKLILRPFLGCNMPEDGHEATPEEKAVILAGLRMNLEDITKRCKTYWRRYGASKLNTWTYLSD
jgi:hypothetical protein